MQNTFMCNVIANDDKATNIGAVILHSSNIGEKQSNI